MSRIKNHLSELTTAGRKALIAYIVAGDPNPAVTVPFMHTLVEKGVDLIELGVPFSDPMAEGPTIQRAHERALQHKISLRDTLAMLREFRQSNSTTPVIIMGYANPIEVIGYDAFCQEAVAAGLDGVLVVDLPPEESADFDALLEQYELDRICLLSPTTTAERAKAIAERASGFLYYVSLKGVTGAATINIEEVQAKIDAIKAFTDIPLCVGFGIKDGDSARRLARVADGVVVGSAIVDLLSQGDTGLMKATSLVEELRAGLD